MDLLFSKIYVAFFILARISTIIFIVPVFGYGLIPVKVKIALCLLLTLLVFPFVNSSTIAEPQNLWMFFFMISKEVIAGMIIGFTTTLLFLAFQFAGTLVGMQMGFGIVNVIDPQMNIQVSIMGQFMYIIAMLLFLAIDGHQFLIQALVQSFQVIPLTGAMFGSEIITKMVSISAQVFVIAVKIGIPAIIALLLTSIALGIIARTVPQMNVFIVGFPLNIGLGLIALAGSFPILIFLFRKLMVVFQNDVEMMIKLLS